MKICIPIKENNGMESEVYSHFGSASAFLLYDAEKNEIETLDNSDKNHVHGQCNPISSIEGNNIDGIIVGGIGARAIDKLNAQNIRVYQAVNGSAQMNIELFNKSLLPEMSVENACTHNNHGGGCED